MEKVFQWFRSLSPDQKKRGFVGIALVAVLLGFWYSNQTAPEPEEPTTAFSFQAEYQVHVTGAVVSPGLYILGAGSRVKDAIDSAGGFTTEAVQSSVNLARLLSDGEQILVLEESQLIVQGGGFVSLNRATEQELESLPGIGPSTAKKIADFRTKIGSFSAIEQLLEVPGIGPKLFDQIRDQITL